MEERSSYWQKRLINRRRVIGSGGVAALGLGAAALVGCGGDDSGSATRAPSGQTPGPSPAAAAPTYGGSLVTSVLSTVPEPIDPHRHIGSGGVSGYWPNYLDLLLEIGAGGTLKGGLAEKWELPGDGTEVLLHIRPGVKFHNKAGAGGNREFTTEDAAFSLNRTAGKLDPGSKALYLRAGDFGPFNRAQAVDAKTVKVTLDKPYSPFLSAVAFARNYMIPKEQTTGSTFADYENDKTKLIGTGPFMLTGWENDGQKVTFTKNPDYWRRDSQGGKLPYLESHRYEFVGDASAQLAAFASKQLSTTSAANKVGRQAIEAARKDAVLTKTIGNPGTPPHLRFNPNVEPFTDVRVRKALHLVLDYKDMGDSYYGEGNWAYMGHLTQIFKDEAIGPDEVAKMPGYNPATKAKDIADAKALMAAAGHPDGGISFKIFCWPVPQLASVSIYEDMVRAKAAWEKVWPAIKVELEPQTDAPTFNTKMTSGNFQMVGYFLNFSPDAALGLAANLGAGGARNYAKFKDDEIQRKLDSALVEFDLKKRAVILKEIQLRAFDLVPTMWLHEPFLLRFTDPKFQGMDADFPGLDTAAGIGAWIKA